MTKDTPLKYVFEHQSVKAAMEAAGIAPLEAIAGVEEAAVLSVIYVGWSGRQRLLLRPDNAWLSSAGVGFLRLPSITLEAGDPTASYEEPSNGARADTELWTVLDKWVWSLRELRKDLNRDDRPGGIARLIELRHFASACWPGWYERSLNAISDGSNETRDVNGVIEVCLRQASLVELLHLAAPLAEWIEREDKREHMELVRDLAGYVLQGVVASEAWAQAALKDKWWDELASDCLKAESKISAIKPGDHPAEVSVRQGVARLSGHLEALRVCLDQRDGFSTEIAGESYHLIEQLSNELLALVNLRDRARAVLVSTALAEV